MDKVTATIRSKVGDLTLKFSDPNGREHAFVWNKKNNFTLVIPQTITYVDIQGRTRIAAENYPQDLLNAYGKEEYKKFDGGALVKDKEGNPVVVREALLELVEVKESPSISAPVSTKKGTGSIEFAK